MKDSVYALFIFIKKEADYLTPHQFLCKDLKDIKRKVFEFRSSYVEKFDHYEVYEVPAVHISSEVLKI